MGRLDGNETSIEEDKTMKRQLRYGLMLGAALLAAQVGIAQSAGGDAAMSRIEREVRRELITLPFYSLFDYLSFRVEGDTVTLMGKVSEPTLKSAAEKSVKVIEGVERINNEIEVLPLSPADNGLRVALYGSIYGHTSLQPLSLRSVPPIHIIVKNGHVTLEGYVPNEMARNIANIQANGVSGVFSVTNNLRTDSEGTQEPVIEKGAGLKGPRLVAGKRPAKPIFADAGEDSVEVSGLLSEARTHAAELRQDALEMEAFTRSASSWQTHSAKVSEIRQHVNKMGEVVGSLTASRAYGSAWQQQSIDRILPVLRELASNVEATIDHLNQEGGRRLQSPEYREYLSSSAELASKLAELVTDYLDYGESKIKIQKLTQKLEIVEKKN